MATKSAVPTVNIKNKVLLGLVWNDSVFTTGAQDWRDASKNRIPHEDTKRRRKEKHFFKIGCHLCYAIFVSFATFVVQITRQYQILHRKPEEPKNNNSKHSCD